MKFLLPTAALLLSVSASPTDATRHDLVADHVNANATAMAATRQLAGRDMYVACGVDIVGSDVSNLPYGIPDSCGLYCLLNANQCGSATWSDYQGGTCWVKRADTRAIVPNAATMSVLPRTPGNPAVTWLEAQDNYDMPDFTYQTARRSTFAECQRDCEAHPMCFAVALTDGLCRLKTRANAKVPKAGVRIAILARTFDFTGQCRPL